MAALIDELNTVKQFIAEKRAKQSSEKQNERRIDEILTALDALKNTRLSMTIRQCGQSSNASR